MMSHTSSDDSLMMSCTSQDDVNFFTQATPGYPASVGIKINLNRIGLYAKGMKQDELLMFRGNRIREDKLMS